MVFKKASLEEATGLSEKQVLALRSAERRLAPRILVMVAVFIAINYLDRTNLALASVELTAELGLSPSTYGLGAALFFVSYCLLQVPSQMFMAYVKRRNLYLAGLLVTWGAAAASMAAMRTVPQFLALRVLLGVFEAGALPALWTYLAHFYCKERLTVPVSVMMGTLILSQAAGPLIAAGLMSMDGLGGLAGWSWLFLIEGLIAIVAAVFWLFMPRDVDAVKALTPDELAAVHASFGAGHKPAAGGNQLAVAWAALRNPVVAASAVMKFSRDVAFYGVVYWAPMIVKSMLGYDTFGSAGHQASTPAASVRVVLLVAVPFGAGALFQFVNAWHSQRTNERRFHLALTWALGAVALLVLPVALRSFAAGFAVLVIAAIGTFGAEGIMISHFMAMQGGEKGIGMAIVNAAGGVGGFLGPSIIGALRQHSGSYNTSMYVLGAFLGFAALLVAVFDPAWADKWMLKSAHAGAGAKAGDVELGTAAAGGAAAGGSGGGTVTGSDMVAVVRD